MATADREMVAPVAAPAMVAFTATGRETRAEP
ncbi:hypothetical protein M2272_003699 [Mycobacterium frederiksbergense]|uniref:Uncharacterized protein n=1 Tax=Mycolicibacterium frederiksbergense TaxID=117567 RepID=A0ABT6L263_9MYCO|nr:hypothetical protein [Mycolicibacterium frederiksbergense]